MPSAPASTGSRSRRPTSSWCCGSGRRERGSRVSAHDELLHGLPRPHRPARGRRRRRRHGRREGRRPRGVRRRRRARTAGALPATRAARRVRRRRGNAGPRAERAHLPRRRKARDALQRRRRPGALQLHPAGSTPGGADRRGRVDRRRVACARQAPARGDRADRAARARRAGRGVARAAPRGEGALPDVRGAARLLRGARPGAALVTVFLVGAGPGDPGLITARGLELVRSCDALVYDVLVAPELVAEAPGDALVIPREDVKQARLNDMLVRLGRTGIEVVRLKGGDPFVFGRGSEEAEALLAAGVPFEVVPGVSALSAVPASAGIPVTHRGVSAQVTIVSGHSASGEELDYAQLASAPGTLVVFMGLAHLEEIAHGLVAAGKPASTPAAVVCRGTHADGRSVSGELHAIA